MGVHVHQKATLWQPKPHHCFIRDHFVACIHHVGKLLLLLLLLLKTLTLPDLLAHEQVATAC
jgi:hypothetical protein